MRIDDLNRTPAAQSAEKTDQTAQQRPGTPGKDGVPGSDQAEVSSLARVLSAHDSAPVRDSSRIEQLRLDVQSGKYNVPADAVAGAIVDAHLTD